MSDEDDGHAGLGLQLLHQIQDLGLDGHIERRGRLVADEQGRFAGQRHGDHHPLAHAAGEIVGISRETLGRLGDPHLLQHGDGGVTALGLAVIGAVEAKHLHQLIADRLHRVERRHGLLKDHGDTVATHLVHLLRRQIEQLLPLKADGARHHLTVGPWQQPHDGQRGDALAAAGLADYPQGLARGDLEADPVEHLDLAVVDGELHLEIPHLEDGGQRLPLMIAGAGGGGLCVGHDCCSLLDHINDVHRSCRSG